MEKILDYQHKKRILARIIAHLMGDGCVTKRYFTFTNKNKFLLDSYERDIKKLFKDIHIIKGKYNSGTSLLQVQNKPILLFLKSLIKSFKSHDLEVPNFIDSIKLKSEFIRALYDDEGCVALRPFRRTKEIKRNLNLSSNSLKFLQQIQSIFKKDFNIKTNKILEYNKKIQNKIYTNYVMSITGKENFVKFREKIGFSHPTKKQMLDLMIASYIRK